MSLASWPKLFPTRHPKLGIQSPEKRRQPLNNIEQIQGWIGSLRLLVSIWWAVLFRKPNRPLVSTGRARTQPELSRLPKRGLSRAPMARSRQGSGHFGPKIGKKSLTCSSLACSSWRHFALVALPILLVDWEPTTVGLGDGKVAWTALAGLHYTRFSAFSSHSRHKLPRNDRSGYSCR